MDYIRYVDYTRYVTLGLKRRLRGSHALIILGLKRRLRGSHALIILGLKRRLRGSHALITRVNVILGLKRRFPALFHKKL